MALHLWQVKVWATSSLDKLVCVVEKVKTKVEQRTGHWLTVDGKVLLLKVPSTGTSDESRERAVGAELVLLVALLEVDLATDGVVEVELTVDHVVPCWRARVCVAC